VRPSRLVTLLAFALLALAAVSCADSVSAPNHIETAVPTDTTTVYVVEGDITLTGRLFGADNKSIVILSHQRQNDETAWYPFAEHLAQNGFAALTFNFRGYDGSTGSQDYDKLAADLTAVVNYVRDRRIYSKIFLVGASMGATASLVVAEKDNVDAVVAVSPPAKFASQDALKAVPNVTAPKLFLASTDDAPALDFDDLYQSAADPKDEQVYPGNAHGTDLFDPTKNTEAGSVGDRILGFLQAND
jgi:alpha-beta hydrolase superfamily lysophospholipase